MLAGFVYEAGSRRIRLESGLARCSGGFRGIRMRLFVGGVAGGFPGRGLFFAAFFLLDDVFAEVAIFREEAAVDDLE